jgi:hypothetical protein
MLRDLVLLFDCEQGQDEKVFMHAKQLIMCMMGERACQQFSNVMDAADGRFYLRKDGGVTTWRQMCELAKNDPGEGT